MKFFMPTKIYKGGESLAENARELILGKRAFIVTGRSSGRLSGALGETEAILAGEGIDCFVYDKVSNNPTVEECFEAGKIANEFSADFIIGIGGGSPLDAAKAIAVYAVNPDLEPYDIYKGNYSARPLPMAAIPTTAGTGSEVTQYSVLTNAIEKTKKSFSTEDTFFKVAFLDGKYMARLPLSIARNTAVDALSHMVESYTNTRATAMSEYIALEALGVFGARLDALVSGEISDDDRHALLWASTLGGMAIAQTGTTVVHSMGYPLTYFKDIPHGVANGLLLGAYMKRAEAVIPDKTKKVLSALGLPSVDALDSVIRKLIPTDTGITEAEIDEWVQSTVKARNASTCPFTPDLETEREIFVESLIG